MILSESLCRPKLLRLPNLLVSSRIAIGIVCIGLKSTNLIAEGSKEHRFQVNAFRVYYGSNTETLDVLQNELTQGQLLIVESRALEPQRRIQLQKSARVAGAKLVAYLSIGELHRSDFERFNQFRQGVAADKSEPFESIAIGENRRFNSWHIDVTSATWTRFILAEAARLDASGFDGLFLDTVDTADVYISNADWSFQRRAKSVAAMCQLIRAFKQANRRRYVIQNSGLNILGEEVFVGDARGIMVNGMNLSQKSPDNPDAVLWENAFSAQGDWAESKKRELAKIHRAGHTSVLALGYSTQIDRLKFQKLVEPYGFVWSLGTATDRLHLDATTIRLDMKP